MPARCVVPRRVVGSVAGLVGFGGAMGGVVFNLIVGRMLDGGYGYGRRYGRYNDRPLIYTMPRTTGGRRR